MSLFRFTRTSQPQGPVAIDWGNPITRGLQECVTPQSLLTNVNGATKVATLTGAGLKGNGTSSYFWRPYTGAKITTAGTIFCIVNGATASADARIFSLGSSASTTPIIALQSSGSSAIRGGAFNRAGNQHILDSGITAFESGVPHTLASTFGGGLNKLFQDGIFRQSVASTNDFSSYTLDRVAVGCLLRSTAGSFNSSAMLLGLIWNRALSDAEIKSLSDDPWQIFQPTNRAIYPGTVSGGPVTHATTGALVTVGSIVTGAATRFRALGTSGALGTAGAIIVGAAARAGSSTTHDATGNVVPAGAVITGAAVRFRTFGAIGALGTTGAVITGSAVRFRAFSTTGALGTAGAIITGAAARFRAFDTAGALGTAGAVITGAATRFRAFGTSGALAPTGAVITGAALRFRAHGTSGVLAPTGAVIVGSAVRSTSGMGIYPDPADVRYGVQYGPTGTEYTGTMDILLDLETGRLVKILGQNIALLL